MFNDPFDDIDIGQDFEDFAVGLKPVTVRRINPDSGAVLTEVENVPATKLVRPRFPFATGGGELPGDTTRFVFRADTLGFLPKTRDEIEDADGYEWVIERAEMQGFDELCSAEVHLKRG